MQDLLQYFLLLLFVGFLGMLCQALKKMNELNKRMNGGFKIGEYFKIERFSLLLSMVFVLASAIVSVKTPKLLAIGDYLLGFHFVAGWFGQSLLEWILGRAAKKINFPVPDEQGKEVAPEFDPQKYQP